MMIPSLSPFHRGVPMSEPSILLPSPEVSGQRLAPLAAAHDAPEVSVVIPCLNEARTIAGCIDKALRALRDLAAEGEVIVADNGSTDGSPALARARGARVVVVDRRGYGSALQGGIAAARGRYVLIGDGDDSYDFGALRPFVEHLRQGCDLVVGNRFRGGIRPGAMPWLHRCVGNPLLTGLLNLLFRTPLRDAHCGLRAFRKEAYQSWGLRSTGMEFASEMVVQARLHNARMAEVPVVLGPDGRGRSSHLRSFRDGWRHLSLLVRLRLGAWRAHTHTGGEQTNGKAPSRRWFV
jgi:glycosyltransferase involved in cell wall biosynthesis